MKKSLCKMRFSTLILTILTFTFLFVPLALAQKPIGGGNGSGGKPTPESGVNNLSYPVIWAEGVAKALPGTAGMDPALDGVWWYQWGANGTDPDITPASCLPDPDESDPYLNPDGLPFCDDWESGSLTWLAGVPAADNPLPLAKAFLQKNPLNVWQAGSATPAAAGVDEENGELYVDWIDWGDNLESVDWYTRSQVRTEVVLFQDLDNPMTEYEMRHTDGWGIDEVHGMAASLADPPDALLGPGTRATVYSHCVRLTIQKLLILREDIPDGALKWVPGEGWYADDLINPHIFNGSVHEGGDGPGFYSAEVNVKGRIIYGYTWNVRNLNDDTIVPPYTEKTAAGDYRLTFSFDEQCGSVEDDIVDVELNTYFVEGITKIIVPLEEVVAAAAAEEGESPGGGATGVLVPAEFDESGLLVGGNLTYMDIRILERGGGGNGGGGGGNGSKGGGRSH